MANLEKAHFLKQLRALPSLPSLRAATRIAAAVHHFFASGQRPVIGPKASSPLITLTTL
jgi:hypothetical protein